MCVLTCVCVLSACSSTSSENVATQGIAADIDVIAAGNGTTTVTAQLEVGSGGLGGTVLELGPGDSLTVVSNGIQKTLTEQTSLFGDVSYSASYNFDNADALFTISFNRANGINAPNSNVALPAGFVVQSPTSSTIYSRNDDISIVWQPAGTGITPSVGVTLTCTRTNGIRVSDFQNIALSFDSGVALLPVAAVVPVGNFDPDQLCEGTVSLSRWRRGNLDPNYGEGGDITAEQFEQAQFFVDLAA